MSRPGALLLLLLAACGYSAGFDLANEGIRTVAVEVAGNASFRQKLEVPLMRELHQALAEHSQLVVAKAGRADSRLVVDILDVQGRSLATGGQSPIKEGALEFAVRVRLLREPDGHVVRDRRVLDRAEFRVPVGENLTTATNEAAADLARKIVLALEPDF